MYCIGYNKRDNVVLIADIVNNSLDTRLVKFDKLVTLMDTNGVVVDGIDKSVIDRKKNNRGNIGSYVQELNQLFTATKDINFDYRRLKLGKFSCKLLKDYGFIFKTGKNILNLYVLDVRDYDSIVENNVDTVEVFNNTVKFFDSTVIKNYEYNKSNNGKVVVSIDKLQFKSGVTVENLKKLTVANTSNASVEDTIKTEEVTDTVEQEEVSNDTVGKEEVADNSEAEAFVGDSLFDDEEDDAVEDTFEPLYSEYDANCPLCKGSGKVVNKDGFTVECSCGRKLAEQKKREAKLNDAARNVKLTSADKENVASYGLIPEEYINLEYDSSFIAKRLKESKLRKERALDKDISKDSIKSPVLYSRFASVLNGIVASCKTGNKLKHSYLIAGEKGYGKKTFVYTCLKYLYARNAPHLCKYISLQELGMLKADSIKRAQAVSNAGFYYKDNDEEILLNAMRTEGTKVIKSVIADLYEQVKSEFNRDIADKALDYDSSKYGRDRRAEEIAKCNRIMSESMSRLAERTRESARIAEEYESLHCELVNTWEDYLKAPIVFVYFSGVSDRHFEAEVLQSLLNIRGAKALPTVAILETSIKVFDDSIAYVENEDGSIGISQIKAKDYFWDSVISDMSKEIYKRQSADFAETVSDVVEYDRMVYVNSYYKRKPITGSANM